MVITTPKVCPTRVKKGGVWVDMCVCVRLLVQAVLLVVPTGRGCNTLGRESLKEPPHCGGGGGFTDARSSLSIFPSMLVCVCTVFPFIGLY